VARLYIAFPVILSLCVLGSAGFAQNTPAPTLADQSAGGSAKEHPKKSAEKKTVQKKSVQKNGVAFSRTGQPTSEEAERAARLAEGRKKFFEQSTGFDNSGSDSSSRALSLGGSNGLSPGSRLQILSGQPGWTPTRRDRPAIDGDSS
jgi:hypothetical protein